MKTGFVHIYTGNGKGKTSAAFGMALRAAMAGKKVFIGQFVKSMKYSETRIEQLTDGIEIKQYGRGCYLKDNVEPIDYEMAQAGLADCHRLMQSGRYDLIILDEIMIALYFGFVTSRDILLALKQKSPDTEVILTGRYAPQELIDEADLVTDMTEVKHYYTQGVLSREGFDC